MKEKLREWAKLLEAVADGATIEWRTEFTPWRETNMGESGEVHFSSSQEYRIKPVSYVVVDGDGDVYCNPRKTLSNAKEDLIEAERDGQYPPYTIMKLVPVDES